MVSWMDERPKHGVVLLTNTRLLCACGSEIKLTAAEHDMTAYHRYDRLLDRHSLHRKAQERLGK